MHTNTELWASVINAKRVMRGVAGEGEYLRSAVMKGFLEEGGDVFLSPVGPHKYTLGYKALKVSLNCRA